MAFTPELTSAQLSALERVGKVGSESAATSLSHIVGSEITVSAGSARLLPFAHVAGVVGGPETEVAGVYLAMHGEAEGEILFVLPLAGASALTHRMYAEEDAADPQSPRGGAGLTLVGDVLAASFLNALSGLSRLALYSSPTETVCDMAGAIASPLLARAGTHSEHVLLYGCRFTWGDLTVDAWWFLVPDPDSMNRLLQGLGV